MGRVVKWNRKARDMYVQWRTGKGNLQAWRHKIGKSDDPECRKYRRYAETGKHVALVCTHGEDIGWRGGRGRIWMIERGGLRRRRMPRDFTRLV